MPTITSDHIYHRIAAALNDHYETLHIFETATYEDVERACEELHGKGLNVTTYADAKVVADIFRHLNLVV